MWLLLLTTFFFSWFWLRDTLLWIFLLLELMAWDAMGCKGKGGKGEGGGRDIGA